MLVMIEHVAEGTKIGHSKLDRSVLGRSIGLSIDRSCVPGVLLGFTGTGKAIRIPTDIGGRSCSDIMSDQLRTEADGGLDRLESVESRGSETGLDHRRKHVGESHLDALTGVGTDHQRIHFFLAGHEWNHVFLVDVEHSIGVKDREPVVINQSSTTQ